MVILREYKDEDFKRVKEILKQENIKDINLDGIIYVALDNNKLVGVGKAQLEDSKYFLKYLIIEKDERNKGFGDGLIRAIFNKLEKKNVNIVYFKGTDKYLLKKGFEKYFEENLTVDILSIDMKNFFNEACNCSGKCHGI